MKYDEVLRMATSGNADADGNVCGNTADTLLWQALRSAQRQSGCTTKTLLAIQKALDSSASIKKGNKADKTLLQNANAVVLQLHGCVSCDDYVFKPSDLAIRCPRCGHPRFNSDKKPNEVYIIMYVFA